MTARSPITPATVALDPVEEGIQRRRPRLRPLRQAVAAGGVIVGSHFDRMRRPGLHEADFDPPPPEWAVGQNGGYRGSAWRFSSDIVWLHRFARPQPLQRLHSLRRPSNPTLGGDCRRCSGRAYPCRQRLATCADANQRSQDRRCLERERVTAAGLASARCSIGRRVVSDHSPLVGGRPDEPHLSTQLGACSP